MGAISVMTFMLVVVPMFVSRQCHECVTNTLSTQTEWSVSQFGGHWPDVLVPFVSVTINMNPIIKLGILFVRHARVQAAVKSTLVYALLPQSAYNLETFCSCRSMPIDINQWATKVNPGSALESKAITHGHSSDTNNQVWATKHRNNS